MNNLCTSKVTVFHFERRAKIKLSFELVTYGIVKTRSNWLIIVSYRYKIIFWKQYSRDSLADADKGEIDAGKGRKLYEKWERGGFFLFFSRKRSIKILGNYGKSLLPAHPPHPPTFKTPFPHNGNLNTTNKSVE